MYTNGGVLSIPLAIMQIKIGLIEYAAGFRTTDGDISRCQFPALPVITVLT